MQTTDDYAETNPGVNLVVNDSGICATALCGRMTFVQSMEFLASELGIMVVAEFMEQPEIREEVRRVCIDLAWRYYVGRSQS